MPGPKSTKATEPKDGPNPKELERVARETAERIHCYHRDLHLAGGIKVVEVADFILSALKQVQPNREKWEVRHDGGNAWICAESGKIICEGLSGEAALTILKVICDAHNGSAEHQADDREELQRQEGFEKHGW